MKDSDKFWVHMKTAYSNAHPRRLATYVTTSIGNVEDADLSYSDEESVLDPRLRPTNEAGDLATDNVLATRTLQEPSGSHDARELATDSGESETISTYSAFEEDHVEGARLIAPGLCETAGISWPHQSAELLYDDTPAKPTLMRTSNDLIYPPAATEPCYETHKPEPARTVSAQPGHAGGRSAARQRCDRPKPVLASGRAIVPKTRGRPHFCRVLSKHDPNVLCGQQCRDKYDLKKHEASHQSKRRGRVSSKAGAK